MDDFPNGETTSPNPTASYDATGSQPCVHVLLATYQGAEFVQAQLDSIAAQTHTNWTLTISDDGSKDATTGICARFSDRYPPGRVTLLEGPRTGSKRNFFHLIEHAPAGMAGDRYAFCDQDDVWIGSKLERAIRTLHSLQKGDDLPLLYCGRTQLVDESLRPLGLSLAPQKPLGFGNALLQNVASGNTMVFNRALLKLLQSVSPAHAVWHDWTAYQLVTGCGGLVYFDPEPQVLYRQHHDNVIGSQNRSMDKVQRARMILDGVYRRWGDSTELAMNEVRHHLTPESLELLKRFHHMRCEPNVVNRLRAGLRSRLWRQTRSGQLVFLASLACKLI